GLITVVGVMSHMADADTPADPGNAAARSHFDQAVRTARRAGLRPAHRHLAATSAAITDPAARHTMVRIGAGLVGIDLSGASEGALIPSMTVTAPVLMVRSVRAGQAVGYGGRWRAPVESRLASVQAGYADGVPRIAEGKAQVLIGAVRCPIVGRVSMDQVVVDVSRAAVQPGDTATLWGPGDRGEPTVSDWAQWAGTIPHEIVTGLGDRVQRRIDRTAASAWGVKR
ncbi:MAG: alanine racemase, partial [Demequina sp.]